MVESLGHSSGFPHFILLVLLLLLWIAPANFSLDHDHEQEHENEQDCEARMFVHFARSARKSIDR